MSNQESAFPRSHDSDGHNGMDLRDYMATKAMQGMLAGHFACYGHDNYWRRDAIAEEAYEMAEAMIAERAKRVCAQELPQGSRAEEVLRAHGFPEMRA